MESTCALFRILVVLIVRTCLANYDVSILPLKLSFKRVSPRQSLFLQVSLKPRASTAIIDINAECGAWRLQGLFDWKVWIMKSLMNNDWQNERVATMKLATRHGRIFNISISADPLKFKATIDKEELTDVNRFTTRPFTHFIIKGDMMIYRVETSPVIGCLITLGKTPRESFDGDTDKWESGIPKTISAKIKLVPGARIVRLNGKMESAAGWRLAVDLRDKVATLSISSSGVWITIARAEISSIQVAKDRLTVTVELEEEFAEFYVNDRKVIPRKRLPGRKTETVNVSGDVKSYKVSAQALKRGCLKWEIPDGNGSTHPYLEPYQEMEKATGPSLREKSCSLRTPRWYSSAPSVGNVGFGGYYVIQDDPLTISKKGPGSVHANRASIDGDIVLYQMITGSERSILKSIQKEERVLHYYQLLKLGMKRDRGMEIILDLMNRERRMKIPTDSSKHERFER